jgi:hypothetical protein
MAECALSFFELFFLVQTLATVVFWYILQLSGLFWYKVGFFFGILHSRAAMELCRSCKTGKVKNVKDLKILSFLFALPPQGDLPQNSWCTRSALCTPYVLE